MHLLLEATQVATRLESSADRKQVKLIDFDTVETVQPQTPKKAKVQLLNKYYAFVLVAICY